MSTTVERAEHHGVVRLTLTGPDRKNALGETVRRQLDETCRELRDRSDVRVLVLRGANGDLSGGADLTEEPGPNLPADARLHASRWNRLLDDLERLPQVTVAVLEGWVVGGAVLLAAACDLRLARTDARIRIPEVQVGLPLTWGGLPRLVREIGLSRTRDLVMSGRVLTGEEATSWGFAQRSAGPGDLEDQLDELLTQLTAADPTALAMTRASLQAIGRVTSAEATAWADPDLLAAFVRDPSLAQRFTEHRGEHQAGPDG